MAEAGIEFGVTGVPETFLVGADGVILAEHSGPLTDADAQEMLEQAALDTKRPGPLRDDPGLRSVFSGSGC